MKKQDNTILWIIGIVIFLIVVAQLPVTPWFAIVTKTTCMDNTLSYWDMEGNVLDELGIHNGINNGGIFVPGKLGQGIQFNTTTYVNFPTISSENKTIIMWIKNYSSGDWYFASEINLISGTNPIIPIGPNFGLGLNGSVDEIAVFDKILTSEEISNLSIGIKVCYTVSYEENVSCQDYATELVSDPGYGCLNYSGDFFPHCEYEWIDASQHKIEDNQCVRYFYCQSPCLDTGNCYLDNQTCIENLEYDCYIIIDNICLHKTDYENCTGIDYYSNLTDCQSNITTITAPSITPSSTIAPSISAPSEGTFKDKFTKGIFTIFGFEVKLYHLFLILSLIGGGLYFMKGGRKK